MHDPYLIVGLGNPGRRYAVSRHNMGFLVVDRLATQLNLEWERGRGKSTIAWGRIEGQKIIFAKPQAYMNLSGPVVQQLQQFYKLGTEQLLIICDDINLPFGRIRLRASGSDGGHNGLASIIRFLSTRNFARLRIGIGSNFAHGDMSNYVLGKFSSQERDALDSILDLSVEVVLSFISDGLEAAMNKYNRNLQENGDVKSANP